MRKPFDLSMAARVIFRRPLEQDNEVWHSQLNLYWAVRHIERCRQNNKRTECRAGPMHMSAQYPIAHASETEGGYVTVSIRRRLACCFDDR